MRIRRYSNVVYVEFCDKIDVDCNSEVLGLDEELRSRSPPWMLEAIPSYGSLAILIDPNSDPDSVARELADLCDTIPGPKARRVGRLHELRVRYGGEYGPDLDYVARNARVSEEEAVRIHTSKVYVCYMLGFTPGFAYLGDLDDRLVTPRLETPRLRVAAGSVGIAGNQTGFYGVESPGGWRLIGRLEEVTFDARKDPPSSILPGDRVRFLSV